MRVPIAESFADRVCQVSEAAVIARKIFVIARKNEDVRRRAADIRARGDTWHLPLLGRSRIPARAHPAGN